MSFPWHPQIMSYPKGILTAGANVFGFSLGGGVRMAERDSIIISSGALTERAVAGWLWSRWSIPVPKGLVVGYKTYGFMTFFRWAPQGHFFPSHLQRRKGKLIGRMSEGRGSVRLFWRVPKAMSSPSFQITGSGLSFFSKAYRSSAVREKFGIQFRRQPPSPGKPHDWYLALGFGKFRRSWSLSGCKGNPCSEIRCPKLSNLSLRKKCPINFGKHKFGEIENSH